MPEYIFNTTALSNFSAADRIDVLKARYKGIAFTTVEVWDELRRGKKAGYSYLDSALKQIEAIGNKGWPRILAPDSNSEHLLRSEFDEILGPGEASCLALAISRGLTFVTDDLAARRLGQERKVAITGTLGILITLVRNEHISLKEANMMLKDMTNHDYRAPIDRLDNLI
jgi:predicted nucleic acid-binding protein